MRQERFNGVASVVGFDKFGAIAVVNAAFVAKVSSFIEDKNMRRCLRPIGASDGLRFPIVEVGIAEVLVSDADFHFVEGVADVGGVEFVDA